VFWLADVPGEQVGDAIDGVIGDAGEHVAEPGFRVEAVELGGFDQGVEGRSAITAGVGAGEEVVLPAEGQRPDLPFGGVVVDLQPPVVEVAAERRPEGAGVADGGGEDTSNNGRFSGYAVGWRGFGGRRRGLGGETGGIFGRAGGQEGCSPVSGLMRAGFALRSTSAGAYCRRDWPA
jgi:hypothetical protein